MAQTESTNQLELCLSLMNEYNLEDTKQSQVQFQCFTFLFKSVFIYHYLTMSALCISGGHRIKCAQGKTISVFLKLTSIHPLPALFCFPIQPFFLNYSSINLSIINSTVHQSIHASLSMSVSNLFPLFFMHVSLLFVILDSEIYKCYIVLTVCIVIMKRK